MKKNVYEAPVALVVCLETVDVVMTSLPFEDPNMIPDGWQLED